MSTFVKFPSIENFTSLHHSIKKLIFVADRPTLMYRGKVKLHGTNAGVHVKLNEDGTAVVTGMKRSGFVTPDADNAGFANWLEDKKHIFAQAALSRKQLIEEMTIFGEWAGPGVQKHDAVTQIPKKTFFIFAIRVGAMYITSPITLKFMVPETEDIKILPWATEKFTVDLRSSAEIQKFLDSVNLLVEECGKCDPYIKDTYGVEGPGEGFVFYPADEWGGDAISNDEFFFVFKAKSEAHSQSGNKTKAAEIDPVLHDSASKFAAEYVTDARMDQAIIESGVLIKDATRADTGKVLKWIGQDIHKESVASLEANGLEWNQVAKAVNELARYKFFKILEGQL